MEKVKIIWYCYGALKKCNNIVTIEPENQFFDIPENRRCSYCGCLMRYEINKEL